MPEPLLRQLHTNARRLVAENRLADYRPYPKQAEFHEAGATFRERLLMAGNQLGKTWSGGAEFAMHLTGRYPDWWRGKAWHEPVAAWCAGLTTEKARDGVQRILMGRWNALGTGMIPKGAIRDYTVKRGMAEAIDTVYVRYGGGGDVQADDSMFVVKSYDQGAEKFASETLHLVWLDEEPGLKIYTEALTRTNTTGGIVFLTFTPLLGMSEVVSRFMLEENPDRHVTRMEIDDAEHIPAAQRAKIIASYPAHEREARTKGIPVLGSGRVFPVPQEHVQEDAIPLAPHWPRIAAMDFGWDHPTAAVWAAWDRDADIVHVYDCYRVKEQPVAVHAGAIRSRGKDIPMAWPHDGNNDTAIGPQLAKQYRDAGIAMLPQHAQFERSPGESEDNTRSSLISVEAGVQEMLTRMMEGRLRVAAHLKDWWEEYLLYHRKDGKIVKEKDDLMSATRYLIMSLRFAKVLATHNARIDHRRRSNWRAI